MHSQEEKKKENNFVGPLASFYHPTEPSVPPTLAADCSTPSPGQRPGQAGRKHPRTVGDEQDRTGLDLRQGKPAIHHHVEHTNAPRVHWETVNDRGQL